MKKKIFVRFFAVLLSIVLLSLSVNATLHEAYMTIGYTDLAPYFPDASPSDYAGLSCSVMFQLIPGDEENPPEDSRFIIQHTIPSTWSAEHISKFTYSYEIYIDEYRDGDTLRIRHGDDLPITQNANELVSVLDWQYLTNVEIFVTYTYNDGSSNSENWPRSNPISVYADYAINGYIGEDADISLP